MGWRGNLIFDMDVGGVFGWWARFSQSTANALSGFMLSERVALLPLTFLAPEHLHPSQGLCQHLAFVFGGGRLSGVRLGHCSPHTACHHVAHTARHASGPFQPDLQPISSPSLSSRLGTVTSSDRLLRGLGPWENVCTGTRLRS